MARHNWRPVAQAACPDSASRLRCRLGGTANRWKWRSSAKNRPPAGAPTLCGRRVEWPRAKPWLKSKRVMATAQPWSNAGSNIYASGHLSSGATW